MGTPGILHILNNCLRLEMSLSFWKAFLQPLVIWFVTVQFIIHVHVFLNPLFRTESVDQNDAQVPKELKTGLPHQISSGILSRNQAVPEEKEKLKGRDEMSC